MPKVLSYAKSESSEEQSVLHFQTFASPHPTIIFYKTKTFASPHPTIIFYETKTFASPHPTIIFYECEQNWKQIVRIISQN